MGHVHHHSSIDSITRARIRRRYKNSTHPISKFLDSFDEYLDENELYKDEIDWKDGEVARFVNGTFCVRPLSEADKDYIERAYNETLSSRQELYPADTLTHNFDKQWKKYKALMKCENPRRKARYLMRNNMPRCNILLLHDCFSPRASYPRRIRCGRHQSSYSDVLHRLFIKHVDNYFYHRYRFSYCNKETINLAI